MATVAASRAAQVLASNPKLTAQITNMVTDQLGNTFPKSEECEKCSYGIWYFTIGLSILCVIGLCIVLALMSFTQLFFDKVSFKECTESEGDKCIESCRVKCDTTDTNCRECIIEQFKQFTHRTII